MTTGMLSENIALAVPLNRAPYYLEQFFTERRTAVGTESAVMLTIPELPGGIAPEHSVLATFVPAGRWNGWGDSAEVSWRAKGVGPSPIFLGELKILADEHYDTAWLAIDGGYILPSGAAGRAFDATVAHAIAQSTAKHLLRQLKSDIERYRVDEERVTASLLSAKINRNLARTGLVI